MKYLRHINHGILRLAHTVGHWRLLRLAAACLIIVTALIPLYDVIETARSYSYSHLVESIIGTANPNLSTKFSFDAHGDQWQFNKNGAAAVASTVKQSTGSDASKGTALAKAQMQAQVGGGGKDDTSLYSVNLPVDASKGVTYFDNNTKLSFTMTPQFELRDGKYWQHRVVYPLVGGGQLIYTAKANGLKEDIVFDHYQSDEMTFAYKLNLPNTLEARIMDDGAIGIYSASPALFGNITYGDDADMAKIMDARKNADKTHLVFAVPAPIIKDKAGHGGHASFSLRGDTLTLTASGLRDLSYPLSVDPSVVVTSSSDFSTGNDEDNISFDGDSISRTSLSGGVITPWQISSNNLPKVLETPSLVEYDNYLYLVGGKDTRGTGQVNLTIYRAAIGNDGSLGSWQAIGTQPETSRGSVIARIYNKRLYLMGGDFKSIFYAPLNSDDTIGDWHSATTPPSAIAFDMGSNSNAAFYNGFIYLVGGSSTVSQGSNLAYYTPIKADGSLGAWQATSTLPQSIQANAAVAYNGYIYSIGGANADNTAFVNSIYYAKIKPDGGLSSWMSTNSYSGLRYGHYAFADRGYIYIIGGWTSNKTYYAQINADGTLGTWQTTSNLATSSSGLRYPAGAIHNGYIYLAGGRDESTKTDISTVQYTKVLPAGTASSYATTTAVSTAPAGLSNGGAAIYGRCIYQFGGFYSSGGTQLSNKLYYATINTDGTIGSWTASSNTMVQGVAGFSSTVSDGYLYVINGQTGGPEVYTNKIQYVQLAASGCNTGTWQTNPTNYVGAIGYHEAVADRGYIYSVGDLSSSSAVYSAPIKADHTLGSWTAQPSLLQSRMKSGLVISGNYIYEVGGNDKSGSGLTMAEVEYAQIQSPGTLGSWQTTSSLNTPRESQGVIIRGGMVYAIGGQNNGTDLGTIEYAPIKADGSLGSWVYSGTGTNTAPTSGIMTSSRSTFGVGQYGDHIYLVTGRADSAWSKRVDVLTLNNGGSGQVGSWQTTSELDQIISSSSSVAYNGYIYALGGIDGAGNAIDTVYYVKVGADGSLGSWQTTTSMQLARYGLETVVANGYVYTLGGRNGTSYYNDVYYAPIKADGTLGSWQSTESFATGRFEFAAARYGNYMYVLGGYPSSSLDTNDVQYAPIKADGTLGSWQSTTDLPENRGGPAAVAYNGYLYVTGGHNVNKGANYDDVSYAAINPDGSIGNWQVVSHFPIARWEHEAFIYNGYMYILGGDDGIGNPYDDVEYAPINPDGSIGNWTATTSPPTARTRLATAISDGYLYAIGGLNSSRVPTRDVYYAPIDSIARVGHYSKIIALDGSNQITGISFNGKLARGLGDISYQAAGSDGVFGSVNPARATSGASGGAGRCDLSSDSGVQYIRLLVTLDGPDASLSDLTVRYSPLIASPDMRLHGGKFFANGSQQALDTCSGLS